MLVNPITYGYGLDAAVQSLRRTSLYTTALRTQDRLYDVASRQAAGGSRVEPRQADSLGYQQSAALQSNIQAFKGVKENIAFGQKAIESARETVKTVREMLTEIRDKVIAYQDNTLSAGEKRAISNEVITLQARTEGAIVRAQQQNINLLNSSVKRLLDSTPAQLAATSRTTYEIDLNGDGAFDVSYDGTNSNSLSLTPDAENLNTGSVLADSTKTALFSINTDLEGGSDVNANLRSALSAYQNGQQTSSNQTVNFQAPGVYVPGGGDDDERHRNTRGRGHDHDGEHGHGRGHGHGHHGGGDGDDGYYATATGRITSGNTLGLTTTSSGGTLVAGSTDGLVVDFDGDGVNDLTINTSTTTNLSGTASYGNDSATFGGSGSTQTNTSVTYTSIVGGGDDDDDDDDDDGHGRGHGIGHGHGHGHHGRGDDDDDNDGGTVVTTTVNVASGSSFSDATATGSSGSQTSSSSSTINVDRDGDGQSDFSVRVTTTTTYDYSGFGTREAGAGSGGPLPVFGESAGVTDVPSTEFSANSIGLDNINLGTGLNSALTNVEKSLKKTDQTEKFLNASAERLALQDEQLNATISAAKGGIETIVKADEVAAKAFVSAADERKEIAKKALAEGAAQAKSFSGMLVNVQADTQLRQQDDDRRLSLSGQASDAYGKTISSALPPIRSISYPIVAPTAPPPARDTTPSFPYELPGIDEIA